MDPKIKKFSKNFRDNLFLVIGVILIIGIILLIPVKVSAIDPSGPDSFTFGPNSTKGAVSAKTLNVSGGYIAQVNITATVQDVRWKAFVGHVLGSYTLSDATNSKIYDWSLSSLTGRVYATRNDTTISWAYVNCSNVTTLEHENILMNHTNIDDNLTKTFNLTAGATHRGFYVGNRFMTADTCPTLNTYRSNSTQDASFEEMALYDTSSIVYATILENNLAGYDGHIYDFQMIVPENGLASNTGNTIYYLYVEIGT